MMSVALLERIPRVIYTTADAMDIEEKKESTIPFDEPNSSIQSGNASSVRMTTLTNTAIWIHENSLRMEEELQYLEKQIQLLHEQDLVLNQIAERIHALDHRVKNADRSALSTGSSNEMASIVTNLG